MSRPSHREAFRGKKPPLHLGEAKMEGQLKALIRPPRESGNRSAHILRGPGFRNPLSDQAAKPGVIAYLGTEDGIPANCWVKTSQPVQLDSGSHKHPVLILAREDNLLLCASLTSWGGQTPQEKYSKASPAKLDDILHQNMELIPTVPGVDCATPQLGGLTHSGPAMDKRTFMSLQRAFWIEAHLLEESIKGGRHRQLTADSLGMACWAYHTAHSWRQRNGVSEEVLDKNIQTPSLNESWRPVKRENGLANTAQRQSTPARGGIRKLSAENWRAGSEQVKASSGLTVKGKKRMSGDWWVRGERRTEKKGISGNWRLRQVAA